MEIRFTWSEAKRESNWIKHRLDFADVERVFAGVVFTYEDTRFCYSERRFVTLGLLHETPVHVVYASYAEEIRIISFRKATRREAKIYFEEVRH